MAFRCRSLRLLPMLILSSIGAVFFGSLHHLPSCFHGIGCTAGHFVKQSGPSSWIQLASLSRSLHATCCKQGPEVDTMIVREDDKVQVLLRGKWRQSTILAISGDRATCRVKYDDGGIEDNVNIAIRVRAVPTPLQVGDKMEVRRKGTWYDCVILAVSDNQAVCTVKYKETGDEEANVNISSRTRTPRIKLSDLTIGQKFRGQVEGLGRYGLFVNIGAEKSGLVHISCIVRNRFIEDVREYVRLGQMVDVWVVKKSDGELGLTMINDTNSGDEEEDGIRTPRIKLSDLEIGQKFRGQVQSFIKDGVFVDIGAEKNGLVHISRVARNEYVENVRKYVRIGQMVDVWVIHASDVQLGLTMVKDKRPGDGRHKLKSYSGFENVSSDQWLDGIVERIVPWGVFVSVTPPDGSEPRDGLLHVSQIRDGWIANIEDEVEIGQKIKVRMLKLDADNERLGLSMKEPINYGFGAF